MVEKDRAIMSGVYRTANGCGDHPGCDVHICWPEEMISEVAATDELSNPAKKELSKVLRSEAETLAERRRYTTGKGSSGDMNWLEWSNI